MWQQINKGKYFSELLYAEQKVLLLLDAFGLLSWWISRVINWNILGDNMYKEWFVECMYV